MSDSIPARTSVTVFQSGKTDPRYKQYYQSSTEASELRIRIMKKYIDDKVKGVQSSLSIEQLYIVRNNLRDQQVAILNNYLDEKLKNTEIDKKRISFGNNTDLIPKDIRNYKNFRAAMNTSQYYHQNKQQSLLIQQNTIYPSQSYYMSSNDFLFSEKIDCVIDDYNLNSMVQPIVLNEFQPDETVYFTKLASNLINNTKGGAKIADNITKILAGTIGEAISKNTENVLAELIAQNPDSLFNYAESEYKAANPLTSVFKLFPNGRWLNTYELPYFGNVYLEANQYDKWSVRWT